MFGMGEEPNNVDENIVKCRGSLFALLGPAYAYKCLLSPLVQNHLWKTYNLPVLVAGLSALPIRPANITPLTLRGFIKLSNPSPVPDLYFLLGELSAE